MTKKEIIERLNKAGIVISGPPFSKKNKSSLRSIAAAYGVDLTTPEKIKKQNDRPIETKF